MDSSPSMISPFSKEEEGEIALANWLIPTAPAVPVPVLKAEYICLVYRLCLCQNLNHHASKNTNIC